MCITALSDEITGTLTLICGSKTVIHNLFEFLDMENERHRNEGFQAPHVNNTLRIPIFNWPTNPKPARDPVVFDLRWLLIVALDIWCKKVLFPHRILPSFFTDSK